MKDILKVRQHIYDQFHSSSAGSNRFYKPVNADQYAAYYTSMYLIQDTGEAVWVHMNRGFSQEPAQAYIEFWGVAQAIVIQQEAICELHCAILGAKPDTRNLSAWRDLRNIRHLCTGHPANRSHGHPKPQRTFMGRGFGTYDQIEYEVWDANTLRRSHPTFNLARMIREYDTEASKILQNVLDVMKSSWP